MTDLRGFVDGGAPDDDLTVLAMRVNESIARHRVTSTRHTGSAR